MWAGGGDSPLADQEIIRELQELGLHEEVAALASQSSQAAHYMWPENWQAWEYFSTLSDQWLISPMGGAIGINGAVVLQYLSMAGLSGGEATRLYTDIRLIANGALKAWREKSEKG